MRQGDEEQEEVCREVGKVRYLEVGYGQQLSCFNFLVSPGTVGL